MAESLLVRRSTIVLYTLGVSFSVFLICWSSTLYTSTLSWYKLFDTTTQCIVDDSFINQSEIIPQAPLPYMLLRTHKPNGKIMNCRIPKAMTTLLNVIYGYIYKPENCRVLMHEKASNVQYHGYSQEGRTCHSGVKEIRVSTKKHNNYTTFAIAREPISRFLSGWLEKCFASFDNYTKNKPKRPQCLKCGRDLGCFIQKIYKKFKAMRQGSKQTFKLVDHFMPWSWLCRSFGNFSIKFIKYQRSDAFYDSLTDIFLQQNVTYGNEIRRFLLASSTRHATFGSQSMIEALKMLSRREDLYRRLIHIYYHDYMQTDFFPIYPNFSCWLRGNPELQHITDLVSM